MREYPLEVSVSSDLIFYDSVVVTLNSFDDIIVHIYHDEVQIGQPGQGQNRRKEKQCKGSIQELGKLQKLDSSSQDCSW
jgi:hypothetical protein